MAFGRIEGKDKYLHKFVVDATGKTLEIEFANGLDGGIKQVSWIEKVKLSSLKVKNLKENDT